ncbi:hypothetical protein EDC96DRAFT_7323 [Choanephora cucurbitarum]|nr:hypothetical protein EDC96DRAFT_7323 [Choanephora cucurbitarum]
MWIKNFKFNKDILLLVLEPNLITAVNLIHVEKLILYQVWLNILCLPILSEAYLLLA